MSSGPKIEPLKQTDWSPEQAQLMQPMLDNQGVGPIASNLFTTLVRHPNLFKRWSVFANHILFKSTLGSDDRELLILRIAWLCQADYEWGQHVLIAREIGMSESTISDIQKSPKDGDWSPKQISLLNAADELHKNASISDETWNLLNPFYNEQQLTDLVFTVGNYRMLATFMNSVNVERDAGVPGFGD